MINRKCALVYGIHAIQAILDDHAKSILCVYIIRSPLTRRLRCLLDRVIEYSISVQRCERSYLDAKVKGALHQGIIANVVCTPCRIQECNLSNFLVTRVITTPLLLLILDGVTDPHNLGACLRTADAAGVDLVIAPRDRSVCINSTVRKVASGAADRVPFLQVINLNRILRLLQQHDIWIIGTVLRAKKVIFHSKLTSSLAFVMGSEGYGIRQLTQRHCNELVNIPIFGTVASLNVSVATGICLFEVLRQRKFQQ